MTWNSGLENASPAYNIAASDNSKIRVVAGPGSGKSFAMKRRVARLLESGIAPAAILPVTFTRVAAEDLHRELVGMGVEGCNKIHGTTLHSLALKILMRNHVLLATGRTPRPLNSFERKPLEADLSAHGGVREIRKKILAFEAAWARLQPDTPGYAQTQDDASFSRDLVQWLRFHQAMVIGEVIPQLFIYLHSNPAAPERGEYSHILVDEFQDLNKAEQSVVDLLAGSASVCIVGDDDQSVYSFKHAHPEGIRNWVALHHGADDLTLSECRRCPGNVVQMANSLISHNVHRLVQRQLAPRKENGDGDVRILQYGSLESEISGISRMIIEMVQSGVPPGDILVLAQRSAIGTPIYERIMGGGIPAKSYYSEAELDVEDAQRRFALLKLFVDKSDRVALRWLLGLGASNWRSPGYHRIRKRCEETNDSPWDLLIKLTSGVVSLPHVKAIVSKFREIRETLTTLESCPGILGVVDHLFPVDCESTRGLREASIGVLTEMGKEDRSEFLTRLTSKITAPEVPSDVEEVRIMSLHKSKGLSSPITIISGCVEGLLPTRPGADLSPDEAAAYFEEQRRLFYVGITRVKADPEEGKPGTLILSYSRQMPLADAMQSGISPARVTFGTAMLNASRFIHELGASAPRPIIG